MYFYYSKPCSKYKVFLRYLVSIKEMACMPHNKGVEKLIFDIMWLYDKSYSQAYEMIKFYGYEYMVKKVEEDKLNV